MWPKRPSSRRCPYSSDGLAGEAREGLNLGLPQDPVPLKLQGHETGRMKALFMEFQQETHENIPAPRIPTGKPREHSCSWGSSWKLESIFSPKEAGQGGGRVPESEERACPTIMSGP